MKNENVLKAFFDNYARISTSDDLEPLAAFYADTFMVAGPEGSAAFKNDDHFITWLDQLRALNERSGLKTMKILAFDTFSVNDQYKGATITWGAQFEKTGEELIPFMITYYVYLSGNTPKIIMYISDSSQEQLMKEKGLL